MRMFVPLTPTEYEQLKALAEIDKRPTRLQAAALIAKGLADDPRLTNAATDRESDKVLAPV